MRRDERLQSVHRNRRVSCVVHVLRPGRRRCCCRACNRNRQLLVGEKRNLVIAERIPRAARGGDLENHAPVRDIQLSNTRRDPHEPGVGLLEPRGGVVPPAAARHAPAVVRLAVQVQAELGENAERRGDHHLAHRRVHHGERVPTTGLELVCCDFPGARDGAHRVVFVCLGLVASVGGGPGHLEPDGIIHGRRPVAVPFHRRVMRRDAAADSVVQNRVRLNPE